MDARRTPRHRPGGRVEAPKEHRNPNVSRRTRLPAAVRLRATREVLQLAASRRMRLDEIADLFGVNRDHLLRIFRQSGQLSPMRQVRRLELSRVVKCLWTSDASVEALAEQFAYADGSSLRRALRRAFGKSIRELRKGTGTG